MSKSIFLSRTFWVGAVQVLVGLLILAKVVDLPPEAGTALILTGLAALGLRAITRNPVSLP